MSRTSIINGIRNLLNLGPTQKMAQSGLITTPNTRIPVNQLISESQQEAYQAFLSGSQAPFMDIRAVSEGTMAFVNRGRENQGVFDSSAPSTNDARFYVPVNFDRCVLYTNDAGRTVLVAKGAGLRTSTEAYLKTEGILDLPSSAGMHKPIDLNPSPEDYKLHPLVGGIDYKNSMIEVDGASALLNLTHQLGTGENIGGMIFPLAVRRLRKMPVLLDGDVSFVRGWNFFSSRTYMNTEQLLNMVKNVQLKHPEGLTARAANFFLHRLEAGKRVPLLIRWLVGRAFMKIKNPAVYEYICEKGDFRIGHAYNRLVETPLSKEKMDKSITQLYALFSQKVKLPRSTSHDLSTREGRISYLQDIYRLNPVAAKQIAHQIAAEVGRQLGILHGAGGHTMGHIYIHHLGRIVLTLENKIDGKRSNLVLEHNMGTDIDLNNYRIVAMTAEQSSHLSKELSEKVRTHGYGAGGGGCTRPDNLGYGLRDLGTIRTKTEEDELHDLVSLYVKNHKIEGVDVESLVKYFHLKMVQQADLDMLFVTRFREEVSQAGGLGEFGGSFVQLAQFMGFDRSGFDSLTEAFQASYSKYYALSRDKNAYIFFQELDAAADTPRLRFHSPSEDGTALRYINNLFQAQQGLAKAA